MHAQAWAALASLIAGSPFMRFATRDGKYPAPRTNPPRIGKALPSRAAAIMVHGVDGSVATLCLDLDTSRALQGVVDSDAAAIAELLTSCGLRFVADHSPSGGRHIYVPLIDRLPAEDARELVDALALRFASLDAGPHRSITSGCIRPPGSWHKSMTGHQVLDMPLSEAFDVMKRRNHANGVAALRRALAASIHQLRTAKRAQNTALTIVDSNRKQRTSGTAADPAQQKRSALKQVAQTGIYDTTRYPSASEARLAVLTHLANYDISLEEIQRRMRTDLLGLAALYGTEENAKRLLPCEWAKAQARVAANPAPKARGKRSSLKSDTEPALTHSGGTQTAAEPPRSELSVMQEINDIENVLYAILDRRLARVGREGITLRMLLRAVIGFARTKRTLVLDVGCRTFSLETGRHHATIARLLPRLAKLTGGLVERIEHGRGRRGDTYLLTLPEQWKDTAKAVSWRKGKIFGVRPVFWVLGDVAALVYESIERARLAPTTSEIVQATGIGRTAVDKALMTMAEMSMIERRHGAWEQLSTTNLTQIAEWLGAHDEYEFRKARVKAERQQWHAHLERFLVVINEEDMYDEERDTWNPGDPNVDNEPEAAQRRQTVA